ncbi:hypothetical protein M758_12G079200 [Ceratodon purpureus]|nr:hypothetical protein M758_12G079200 [Ceratodon purpureus]
MAAMASLASSCAAFLEGCDGLRARGVVESAVQRREGGVAVRCDVRRSDGVEKGAGVSRRQAVCAFVAGALVLPVAPMARALLEADDDDSLLEKVKEDKKKRIQKRSTAINEFVKESGFVQVAVYKLSEAGQAIDGGDYSKATAVLAQQNADWIRDIQAALSKVSSNPDEKAAADSFRTALSSLQAAVKSGDSVSSRTAFIASAEALDRWTRLTGLSEKVVGL